MSSMKRPVSFGNAKVGGDASAVFSVHMLLVPLASSEMDVVAFATRASARQWSRSL